MASDEIIPPGKSVTAPEAHPVSSAIEEVYGNRGITGGSFPFTDVAAPIGQRATPNDSLQRPEASDPHTSVERLRVLGENPRQFGIALAQNQATPPDVILKLASFSVPEVRLAVAERESLPEQVLRTLAQDRSQAVRIAIAGREHLPEDLVRKLASDRSTDVRIQIARRDDLPADVRSALCQADQPIDVQRASARSRDASSADIETLSFSGDKYVLLGVAYSPNASEAALVRAASFRAGDFRDVLMAVESNPNQTEATRSASAAGREAWQKIPLEEQRERRGGGGRIGQASVQREMRARSESRLSGKGGALSSLAIIAGAGLELFDPGPSGENEYKLPGLESGQ